MTLPKNLDLIDNLLSEKYLTTGDLNTLVDPGFYFIEYPQNSPLDSWGHVIVTAGGTGRVMQIYLSDHTNDAEMYLYYRQKVYATWTGWRKVARDDGEKYLSMHDNYTGDLNDLTNPGLYYIPHANGNVHAPSSGNWGHLLVSNAGDKTAQLWFDDNTFNGGPYIFIRVFNSGWSDWTSFATMAQVTAEVTRVLTTAEF